MLIRYRRFAPSTSYIDIKGARYRRPHCSISKVTNLHYRTSILWLNNRVADIEVSVLWYRTNTLRFSMLKSYTISKVTLTFDIEGHVIHIGFDIGYYIAHSQYYSLRSRQALIPLYHAWAEESPRHVPWIPAESCTLCLRNSTACSRDIWRGKVLP